MKIIRYANINATNFEYLSVGTVFKINGEDDSLYMKIKDIKAPQDTMYYNNIINAIALDNGEAMGFLDCATVTVVDGEFVTNM